MKRFFRTALLVLCTSFLFTGCSAEEIATISEAYAAEPVERAVEERILSEDWKDFEFQIEDTVYDLPINSQQLKALTKSNFIVENGKLLRYDLSDDALLCIKLKNKPILMVGLKEEVLKGEECLDSLITSIGQTAEQAKDAKMAVIFPGGAYAGMEITWDALFRIYGKPDVTTDYYSEKEYKWTLGEQDSANYLQIFLKENEFISEIKLDYSEPVSDALDLAINQK